MLRFQWFYVNSFYHFMWQNNHIHSYSPVNETTSHRDTGFKPRTLARQHKYYQEAQNSPRHFLFIYIVDRSKSKSKQTCVYSFLFLFSSMRISYHMNIGRKLDRSMHTKTISRITTYIYISICFSFPICYFMWGFNYNLI